MTLEVHMRQMVWTLWREEDGQDTIEYVLLLAFIVIAATAVLGFNTNSIRGIASTSNSQPPPDSPPVSRRAPIRVRERRQIRASCSGRTGRPPRRPRCHTPRRSPGLRNWAPRNAAEWPGSSAPRNTAD